MEEINWVSLGKSYLKKKKMFFGKKCCVKIFGRARENIVNVTRLTSHFEVYIRSKRMGLWYGFRFVFRIVAFIV